MPKRTTPFQATVHLVREHYAGPNIAVTESKMLTDNVLGVQREVDIVVEGELDGDQITISIEVNERSRPATLPWVQEQIGKHRHLRTNRLVLVSKEGFSAAALAAVSAEGGWVEALRPEVVTVDGSPAVGHLWEDRFNYTPTGCVVKVVEQNGETTAVVGEPDMDVYDAAGAPYPSLVYLVAEVLRLRSVELAMATALHNDPEREERKGFTLGVHLDAAGYHLRRIDTGELVLIREIEVSGRVAFVQREVVLTVAKLGGRIYSAGESKSDDEHVVWVGTADGATGASRLSRRVLGQPQFAIEQPSEQRFPGLLVVDQAALQPDVE